MFEKSWSQSNFSKNLYFSQNFEKFKRSRFQSKFFKTFHFCQNWLKFLISVKIYKKTRQKNCQNCRQISLLVTDPDCSQNFLRKILIFVKMLYIHSISLLASLFVIGTHTRNGNCLFWHDNCSTNSFRRVFHSTATILWLKSLGSIDNYLGFLYSWWR